MALDFAQMLKALSNKRNRILTSLLCLLFLSISKVITTSDDTLFKVFKYENPQELEDTLQSFEFGDEVEATALCSNGSDSIVFGGTNNEATIQKIEVGEDGQVAYDKSEAQPVALKFDTSVTKLEYCANGSKLLGVSQDSHVQLLDVESMKVTSFE